MLHIVLTAERIHHLARRFVHNLRAERYLLAKRVGYAGLQVDTRHLVGYIGRRDMRAPYRHMHAWRADKVHMAIQARPGIPAA